MQTYILDPSGLAVQRRRSLKQSFMIYGLVIVGVLAVLNRGDFSFAGLIGLAAGAASALLIAGLLTWAGLRNLDAQWTSYQLILDGEHITRRAARVSDVQIQLSQITAVEEYPDTGLMLRTADKRTFVFIPIWLTEYADLRTLLASWQPIVRKQSPTQLFLRCLGAACIPLLGMTALIIAETAAGVVVIGSLLIGGALWAAVQVQRSQVLPRWFKVFGWLMIPLVLVFIAQRLTALQ
jgi:hypothetical protein